MLQILSVWSTYSCNLNIPWFVLAFSNYEISNYFSSTLNPIISWRLFFRILEFEDAFSMFDKRGSGKISISNIFKLIRFLGYNLHEALVWVYMNEQGMIGRVLFFE